MFVQRTTKPSRAGGTARGVRALTRLAGLAAALVLTGGLVAAGPASADDSGTVWLCRPGLSADPCGGGTGAPIDCFYVYPTVSAQPSANANLDIDPEQRAAATDQAAPFGGRCNIWAPIYRQSTAAGLLNSPGSRRAPALDVAYDSLETAWDDYLANHNHGRGVVLIGHSQGSMMLRALIRNRIDGTPQQRLLVSAIIPGADVLVAEGKTTGGDFASVPACTDGHQIGCVLAWSTFAGTPPADAKFGTSPAEPDVYGTRGHLPYGPGYEVLCTDPAAPGSTAETPLRAIVNGRTVSGYHGRCTTGASHVLVIDGAAEGVPATALPAVPAPSWGLHAYDLNIAQQDLVDLVAVQSGVWLDRHAGDH
ncbi:DUF3089 domain-containing protein [Nocardia sp. BMG111209]|uniref:DUF3089 domain-containing protein n=1 Tax=Nocardia sp. BMG111209 TaxID=1160137 RepID=UPI0012DFC3C2|nr:DUF3089 domain-containing protein [Nocardia sp. BMG111209]